MSGDYQPLVWQIVTNEKGFQSLHETNEDGAPGDLIAHLFREDYAEALLALPEMMATLKLIAATPAWGYPERWETTPARVRQLAGAALPKLEPQS